MLGAMSEEKVEEINAEILKQPADLSVADFMKNIKLTQVSADSEVGSNTAIDGTASLNKPYVLVMVVATNKVTNAVIIPNTFEGDIAAPTATIFGEAVTKTIAVTATPTKWTAGGATISIAAADLAAVTADDGGLVVTGGSTGPALSSTIKAVFVENTGVDKDTAGDAPAAADFDSANLDITSAEALKAALTNKPGVIYLQLRSAGSETTNANIGYVAINVSLT